MIRFAGAAHLQKSLLKECTAEIAWYSSQSCDIPCVLCMRVIQYAVQCKRLLQLAAMHTMIVSLNCRDCALCMHFSSTCNLMRPTCAHYNIQTSVTESHILQSSDQLQLYTNLSQAELKKGKEEIQRLKAALLDQEGAVLQRERQLADLKRQLKEERRKGEAPLQMDQAIQADPVQCADLEVQVRDAALTALLCIVT